MMIRFISIIIIMNKQYLLNTRNELLFHRRSCLHLIQQERKKTSHSKKCYSLCTAVFFKSQILFNQRSTTNPFNFRDFFLVGIMIFIYFPETSVFLISPSFSNYSEIERKTKEKSNKMFIYKTISRNEKKKRTNMFNHKMGNKKLLCSRIECC